MQSHNANSNIHGEAINYGGSGGTGGTGDVTINIGLAVPQFSEIPGSWRDF
jgi:hypothetical protein